MPLPPKVRSATIRYTDGSFVSYRSNLDGKTCSYHYYSAPDEHGNRRLIAKNPKVSGVYAALMAVAAMAQVEEETTS